MVTIDWQKKRKGISRSIHQVSNRRHPNSSLCKGGSERGNCSSGLRWVQGAIRGEEKKRNQSRLQRLFRKKRHLETTPRTLGLKKGGNIRNKTPRLRCHRDGSRNGNSRTMPPYKPYMPKSRKEGLRGGGPLRFPTLNGMRKVNRLATQGPGSGGRGRKGPRGEKRRANFGPSRSLPVGTPGNLAA